MSKENKWWYFLGNLQWNSVNVKKHAFTNNWLLDYGIEGKLAGLCTVKIVEI